MCADINTNCAYVAEFRRDAYIIFLKSLSLDPGRGQKARNQRKLLDIFVSPISKHIG